MRVTSKNIQQQHVYMLYKKSYISLIIHAKQKWFLEIVKKIQK